MPQIDLSSLRALPLFRDANPRVVAELFELVQLRRFSKQARPIKEGEIPDFLHIVTEGTVELFANHNNQETTIDVVRAGVPLALAAVISGAECLYSVRTLVPAQMLLLPAEAVRAACARDAAFAQAALGELADRYGGSIRALKNMKLRTSAERLANWILQAVTARGDGADGQVIELICDKRTIASHLGMTPENFSRNMAMLAKYGVRNSGRDIFIDNPAALAQFAKPNALLDG